ncbi:TetR/AcrR family transcriptional regulator [Photobacterium sp. ZSDE20]|uniref:TetR/AcrR family transcriptional regulator n=1 Tax=Photobacterium pectinilyticum TaxID=2906793 RepID=A0ABT1MY87_9GAMM|nr:TetR/AcrR family transcriptional regulator [Photobacterium sp. ZSDE20]MCQ1057349.1 TetR/AcrR family transcriptional regulator [Photobacterium sp. ZSDE20]
MNRQEENKRRAIEATLALCVKHSYHGTSMDTITAATGMSKATIYRHFGSKEVLIAEALALHSQQTLSQLAQLFNDPDLTLEDKLTARFSTLEGLVEASEFHGCIYQQAFNEFRHEDEDIAGVCISYKQERIRLVTELLLANDIKQAKEKATRAELIFNGLLASLEMGLDPELITLAKRMYFEQLQLITS